MHHARPRLTLPPFLPMFRSLSAASTWAGGPIMDLAAEKDRLNAALSKIKGDEIRQGFLSEFDALAKEHGPAADKTGVEARITQLQRHVALAARTPSDWSWFSILLISGVTLGFFGSLWAYFAFLGPERYASISTTRPILVLTLIICMLGFGGLLIVRSLFTTEPAEAFERRFRLAREVFLVFAGIFGTIIGFYFGAADEETANETPAVEVAFSEGQVTAAVSGGAGPFLGILTLEGDSAGELMSVDERMLSFKVAQCPAGARVVVVDGRGRRAEGEVDCGDSDVPGNVTQPDEVGADDAANAVAAGNRL
ncbi:MAG: hypothetical protein ACXW27_08085 [Allosphingosinicella sp.]